MSRRTIPVKITADNRDNGKVYLIKEFPAAQAEWLAIRAFQALVKSGVDIGQLGQESGMAGLATMGFGALGKIEPQYAKPLLDEMLSGITFVPDPDRNPNFSRPLMPDDDIEEVSTYMTLRMEVFTLHTGFSPAEQASTGSTSATAETPTVSNTTRTSPRPLDKSSRPVGRRS